mmetsp:Transcript_17187/g.32803  ORF Transcript_17187/g.32803 Transcript_17187/m.32803 type:complete len:209 (+) Transcript_17187:474-1100(+)
MDGRNARRALVERSQTVKIGRRCQGRRTRDASGETMGILRRGRRRRRRRIGQMERRARAGRPPDSRTATRFGPHRTGPLSLRRRRRRRRGNSPHQTRIRRPQGLRPLPARHPPQRLPAPRPIGPRHPPPSSRPLLRRRRCLQKLFRPRPRLGPPRPATRPRRLPRHLLGIRRRHSRRPLRRLAAVGSQPGQEGESTSCQTLAEKGVAS